GTSTLPKRTRTTVASVSPVSPQTCGAVMHYLPLGSARRVLPPSPQKSLLAGQLTFTPILRDTGWLTKSGVGVEKVSYQSAFSSVRMLSPVFQSGFDYSTKC